MLSGDLLRTERIESDSVHWLIRFCMVSMNVCNRFVKISEGTSLRCLEGLPVSIMSKYFGLADFCS